MKFSKLTFFILLSALFAGSAYSQSDSSGFKLFPTGNNFKPLLGNHQEARIGILYYTKNANLKVDIGNNIDLVSYSLPKMRITAGIEFMAYALSTSYEGKRLQIDALDGFFGGNVSMSANYSSNRVLARLRIIHNSAHLVDGHYDRNLKTWIDDKEPIPYTRDFGEITLAHVVDFNPVEIKYYGSVSYSTLVRPSILKKYSYNAGYEIVLTDGLGKIWNEKLNLFTAYHFILAGVPEYRGSSNILFGAKLGEWEGKGFNLYISYYTGMNILSEYYNIHEDKFGIGFMVDF